MECCDKNLFGIEDIPGQGTVQTITVEVPSVLAVAVAQPTGPNIDIDITYSGVPLPILNGGTALTNVGTNGQVLTSNGTTLFYQTPAVGTVNSVDVTVPSFLQVNGSHPVTTTGSLDIGYSTTPLPILHGGTSATIANGVSGSAFDNLSPQTTPGDIIVQNNSNLDVRLAVGTSNQILTVDSGQPEGIKWATAASPPVPSEYRVVTTNGYGSTNTCIPRWLTVQYSVGTSITYTDSVTLGGYFTIVDTGEYSVSYTDTFGINASHIGISVNTSQATTAIQSVTDNSTRTVNVSLGSGIGSCGWTGNLTAGDIVVAHTEGGTSTGTSNTSFFTIVQNVASSSTTNAGTLSVTDETVTNSFTTNSGTVSIFNGTTTVNNNFQIDAGYNVNISSPTTINANVTQVGNNNITGNLTVSGTVNGALITSTTFNGATITSTAFNGNTIIAGFFNGIAISSTHLGPFLYHSGNVISPYFNLYGSGWDGTTSSFPLHSTGGGTIISSPYSGKLTTGYFSGFRHMIFNYYIPSGAAHADVNGTYLLDLNLNGPGGFVATGCKFDTTGTTATVVGTGFAAQPIGTATRPCHAFMYNSTNIGFRIYDWQANDSGDEIMTSMSNVGFGAGLTVGTIDNSSISVYIKIPVTYNGF